jgi:hypothetical protein
MSGSLIAAAASGLRDVTPTPTPAWANITGSGVGNFANANVNVTGFNQTITLRVNETTPGDTIQYRIDSGTYTTIADEGTFTVAPGQDVNWRVQSAGGATTVWQVLNQSAGDAELDTITATIS